MEIDTMVPPSDSVTSSRSNDDQYVADLLRIADDNLSLLKNENNVLKEERDALEDKINLFRKQVS